MNKELKTLTEKQDKEFDKVFKGGIYGKASIEVDGEKIISYGGQRVYTQDVKTFIAKVRKESIEEVIYNILEEIDKQQKQAENMDEANGYAHSYAIVKEFLIS